MFPKIPERPSPLNVIVFVDGQNFYNDCRKMFGKGETHPHLLGEELCSERFGSDRKLRQVRFYTGIHTPDGNPKMHAYMTRRLEMMKATGVWTFARSLKYSKEWVRNREGGPEFIEITKGREKGVDVRLALDLVWLALAEGFDVAVVVSTDTDLDEAVKDVLELREITGRWLAVENAVCVPPVNPATGRRPPFKRLRSARRLLRIDQEIFDRIRDDTDYWLNDFEEELDEQVEPLSADRGEETGSAELE
ncbi:MAG: NYN domain-containing protein [Actinomycetota bacterium]|nr:NYN domain-containing protein [Actinomycetota bacterium]